LLKHRNVALCAIAIAFLAAPMSLMAQAADPMWASATSDITDNLSSFKALLVVIFGITLAVVVFKLVKRGTNKV
jgi:hypothetical protein